MQIVFILVALCVFASTAFAADAARGKQVYTDSKCAVCHSVAGLGNKKGPLDGVGAKLNAVEIRQWITAAPAMAAKAKAERKPAMKSYPNLTKEDVDALVAHLQTFQKLQTLKK